MKEALETSYKLIKLVKQSPCHDAILQKLKEQIPNDARYLCALPYEMDCQSTSTIHSILANYEVLQILWDESLEIVKD